MNVTIEGIDNLQIVFDGIEVDFGDLPYGAMLKDELGELEQLHAGFFASSTGPDGAKWPPLAPSTVKRKGHSTILVETSALQASLTQPNAGVRTVVDEPAGTTLAFGTDVPYSVFHDADSGSRPARRHVGVDDQFVTKMANRIADAVVKGLQV